MSWGTNDRLERPRSTASTMNLDDVADVSDHEGGVKCPQPGCDKIKKRMCDLRKHMKRHTRPYGCTLPRCYVRHGSRSEWKRHEEKAHCLPVAWKCTLKTDGNTTCPAFAYTSKKFGRHLSGEHKIESQGAIDELCASMRLGRDGYNKFWCGFCQSVIARDPADKRGHREMRWSHIGDHFDQDEGRSIHEWVCFEFNKPYGQITKLERKQRRRKYNEPGSSDDDDELKGQTTPKVADEH